MEKLSYEVRKIAEGVWAINEFDMDYAYVVEGERRSLLIDAGTGTGDLRGLVESLTGLPYDVVCTHGHVDHCGGIGQFSKVYMHPADVPGLLKSGDEGVISVFNRRRYAKLGLALHDPETLPFTLDTFQPVDTSKIEFLPVGEGRASTWAAGCWRPSRPPATRWAASACWTGRGGTSFPATLWGASRSCTCPFP